MLCRDCDSVSDAIRQGQHEMIRRRYPWLEGESLGIYDMFQQNDESVIKEGAGANAEPTE